MEGSTPAVPSRPLTRVRPVTTKERKPRTNEGAAEAKAAAVMTSDEWRELQQGMSEKWPQPTYMSVKIPDLSHTCYRDETYEIVTRWSAETKIAYRPHAKSPGSKSHIRYEAYAKAKTVGQALELGSYPQDWCWDYERGFIKVFGPLRQEPIDITAHTEEDPPLTDVDRNIYRWFNKELSKKLKVNYHDMFGTSDPSIVRAHRLVAQREARQRLADAEAAKRKISAEDVAEVMKKWAFVKNAARANVIPDGGSWVWSDTAGLIRDRGGSIHVTPFTKLYPEVIEIIVKYLTDRLPKECANFTFTSLNLNYNYAARLHRDGNNAGPSFIKAFGSFKGGELNYWPEDDKSVSLEDMPQDKGKLTLQIGPEADGGLALFNGNSCHSVNDFEGDRFSIVYFTLGCHDRAPLEEKEFLRSVGIPAPENDADPRLLLRAPMGIDHVAPKKEDKPPVRFYKNTDLEKAKWKPRTTKYEEVLKKTPYRKDAGAGRKAEALERKRKLLEEQEREQRKAVAGKLNKKQVAASAAAGKAPPKKTGLVSKVALKQSVAMKQATPKGVKAANAAKAAPAGAKRGRPPAAGKA